MIKDGLITTLNWSPRNHRPSRSPAAPGATELSGSYRVAAEAYNTHLASVSTWERIQMWANADDHPALPSTPQAVALYLGHLAAAGRSMASIAQTRVAISHFHAAAGMQKGDNPARHPVVAEAVNSVREVLRLPRRGREEWPESPETADKRAALNLAACPRISSERR